MVGDGEVLGPLGRSVLFLEEGGARSGWVKLQAPLLQDLCDAPADHVGLEILSRKRLTESLKM